MKDEKRYYQTVTACEFAVLINGAGHVLLSLNGMSKIICGYTT